MHSGQRGSPVQVFFPPDLLGARPKRFLSTLWYRDDVVSLPAPLTALSPRVLVVDDEPAIRRVLSDFLQMEGFTPRNPLKNVPFP